MEVIDTREGTVYTETIVYSPPEQFAADAPYQLAIIEHADGTRITVRILGKEPADRVRIGEHVKFAEARNGVLYYKKTNGSSAPELPESPRPLV